MSQVNASDPDVQLSRVHGNGRPYHFAALSQDDRIRNIFRLPEDAPLPPVSDTTLAVYYDYLVAHLSLPFEGLYCQSSGAMRQLIHYLQVTEIIDPRDVRIRNLQGLVCRAQSHKETLEVPLAEFGVREENPNCQLLDDYAYWFVNYHT